MEKVSRFSAYVHPFLHNWDIWSLYGWMQIDVKIRHGYQWHTMCGEVKSVSQEVVDSKERIAVLPCANMTRTEKHRLNGHRAIRPRSFKGMDLNWLPTECMHQYWVWMDSAIFHWVKKLGNKMVIQKRKICLIMDNCRAHRDVKALKANNIVFLPLNTTSVT